MTRLSGRHLALATILAIALRATAQSVGHTDTEIAQSALNAMLRQPSLRSDAISIRVDRQVVTLSGSVRGEADKSLAYAQASQVPGVVTVLNYLNIVSAESLPTAPQTSMSGTADGKQVTVRILMPPGSTDIATAAPAAETPPVAAALVTENSTPAGYVELLSPGRTPVLLPAQSVSAQASSKPWSTSSAIGVQAASVAVPLQATVR